LGFPIKPLSPEQKKEIRLNLTVAAVLFLFYTVVFLIGRSFGMTFFSYFETAGTLLLVSAALHRFKPMYFLGIVAFAAIAQCGGKMFNLYDVIPIYDLILHAASGILLVFMGHYILSLLLVRHPEHNIPRIVTLWFCWLFGAASACVWEIYEFTADRLFGLDCQLWTLGFGGLVDTMTDIIMGTAGALVGVILLRLLLKKQK